MQNFLLLLQEWWMFGLILPAIGLVLFLWNRHYQKTHVQSQLVVTGTLAIIIMVYYIICIISAILSVIGSLLPIFKFFFG